MKKCQKCGHVFIKPDALFCIECGHNNSWAESEIDLPDGVRKYATSLHQLFFDPSNTQEAVSKYALGLRERLKISIDLHETIIAKFTQRRSEIEQMMSLRIEFDESISDAFAGHDCHLRFRVINPHDNAEMFKVTLEWDDPETVNPVDFRAMTNSFVKPGQAQEIAGTHVFMRAGPKQITQMQLTVENQFFDQCTFVVSPFSFRVGSFQQQVVNNITTHNKISIEGRGVVDASNMGASSPVELPDSQPRWKVLPFTLVPETSLLEKLAMASAAAFTGPTDPIPMLPAAQTVPAAAVAQSTAPQATPSVASGQELGAAVSRLFQELEDLIVNHNSGDKARIIASASLGLSLLEGLCAYIGEEAPHRVYGLWVADASSIAWDEGGSVTYFGDAVIFSESGVSVMFNSANSAERQHESRFYEWNQLEPNGLVIHGQKFGPKGFLLFFGDPNSRSSLPGCRFDLRRYQGAQTMDEIVSRLQALLDEIKLFAPLSESTQPRPLGAAQTDTSSEPAVAVASEIDLSRDSDDSWDGLIRKTRQTGTEVTFDNGDQYIGGVINGHVLQGFGIYSWSLTGESAGLRYEGDTYCGMLHGTGVLHYPDGRIDYVVYRRGKLLGQVTDLTYSDGSIFHGTVEDGLAHGFGDLHDPNGTIYRGDFNEGKRHGLGENYDESGNIAECVYYEDEFQGYAEILEYSDGGSYVGTLIDGKPNGFGEIRFANGDYAFGKVSEQGTLQGITIYHSSDGSSSEVVYNNGQCLGAAETLFLEGGDCFLGIVENGIAEKFGVYLFSDSGPYAGHWYEGEMKGGQFNGVGVYSFPDGSTLVGNFVNGKRDNGGGLSDSSAAKQNKGFWNSFKDGFKDGYKSTSG